MAAEREPDRIIACLDMRSFYASCAASDAGLDSMDAYIAVVGNQERKGSIVLAASPRMKKEFGVRTGTRLFEIPGDDRIRLLESKMEFFLRVSMAITELLTEFVPKECVHVYSVDESFVDFTHVKRLWGSTDAVIAHIQDALIPYYPHANGIDLSELGAPLVEGQVSYGKGQILSQDYIEVKDIMTIILEMCEAVAMRARQAGRAGRTIQLGVGYSKNAFGGGFSRSRSIDEATNETLRIYRVCQELFHEHYIGKPVRQISLSISNLEEESSMQLSLFEARKWEIRKLGEAMDQIRTKYGYSAVYRAVSGTEAGTAVARTKLIGGHKK